MQDDCFCYCFGYVKFDYLVCNCYCFSCREKYVTCYSKFVFQEIKVCKVLVYIYMQSVNYTYFIKYVSIVFFFYLFSGSTFYGDHFK